MTTGPKMETETVLSVSGLEKHYLLPRKNLFERRHIVRAVSGVDLSIARGESFGVVGESGSGKSTLARSVMGLENLTAGRVQIRGQEIQTLSKHSLRNLRREFQIVFQDPFGSLDPRKRVADIVSEPLGLIEGLSRRDRRYRIDQFLNAVGLVPDDGRRYPHEFSGGQRQRIAIARALITVPALIVADEPVSALDVSVQAQILNLFRDLQDEFGMAYLFISHDLAVIRFMCNRVAVMKAGKFIEVGDVAKVFSNPEHDYTRALLDAIPRIEM